MQLSSQMSRKADRLDVLAVAAVNPSRNIWPPSNFNIIRSATVYFVRIHTFDPEQSLCTMMDVDK